MRSIRPRGFVSAARSGTNAFVWVLQNLGAAVLVAMVLLITFEAFARTVAGYSTGFTYEVVGVLTAVLGFIALAPTFRSGAHIRITAFVARVPERARNLLDAVAHLLALGYALVLLRYTTTMALDSLAQQERAWSAVPIPVYPFKLALPIGLVAFVIVLLWQLVDVIRRVRGNV